MIFNLIMKNRSTLCYSFNKSVLILFLISSQITLAYSSQSLLQLALTKYGRVTDAEKKLIQSIEKGFDANYRENIDQPNNLGDVPLWLT
jgi:hypothetical protein